MLPSPGNSNRTLGNGQMTAVLTCSFGTMFLARYALGFLAPQLQPDLHLELSQLGMITALLATAWALSGWWVSRQVSPSTSFRTWIVGLLTCLSLSAFAMSMISSITGIAMCSLLFGLAGGPMLPLIQRLAMQFAKPTNRGLIMGLVQSAGSSMIATIIGPMLLIPCAEYFGWRTSFAAIGIVALGCAGAVWLAPIHLFVPVDTRSNVVHMRAEQMPVMRNFVMSRNVVLCSGIGGLMVAWLTITTTFYPLYLTSVRHFTPIEMSRLVAIAGAGSLVGVGVVPWLSDHIGRRLALFAFAILGALAPAALLVTSISTDQLAVLLFCGNLAGGVFPLFMSIIPAESVVESAIPSAIAVVQGSAELLGGVVIPLGIGWLANHHGLHIAAVAALMATSSAGLMAAGLVSTTQRTTAAS